MTKSLAYGFVVAAAAVMVACGQKASTTSTVASLGPSPVSGGTVSTLAQPRVWSAADADVALSLATQNQGLILLSSRESNAGDLSALKYFAFQMLEDFTTAQTILREVGGSQLPPTIEASASDQMTYAQLSSLTATTLDRAYLAAVMQMLQADVTFIQQRGLASSTLDSIGPDSLARATKYLAWARDLAPRVQVPVTTSGS